MIEKRIGDADRNKALDQLQGYYESGHINLEEYQDRSDLVFKAKVASEIKSQLKDLPDPKEEFREKFALSSTKEVRLLCSNDSKKFQVNPVWIVIVVAWIIFLTTMYATHH